MSLPEDLLPAASGGLAPWLDTRGLRCRLRDLLCDKDGRDEGTTERLATILNKWCVGPTVVGAADACASVKIIKPHEGSRAVCLISDSAGRAVAVVKSREATKCLLECIHHSVSSRLCTGSRFRVCAPCIGRDFCEMIDDASVDYDSVSQALRDIVLQYEQEDRFLTIEEAQNLIPQDEVLPPELATLAHRFESEFGGALDLATAVLRTLEGKNTVEELASLLQLLDQSSLERLVIYSTIACLMDMSPENILLRVNGGSVGLIATDTAWSFPVSSDTLELSEENSPAFLSKYWYPSMLFLPATERPLTQEMRKWLRELTGAHLQAVLEGANSMVLDSSLLHPRAIRGAVKRLAAMQAAVQEAVTVRDLAFAAVPCWKRDFPEVARMPDYRLFIHMLNGGTTRFWKLRFAVWTAQYETWRRRRWFLCGGVALAAVAVVRKCRGRGPTCMSSALVI